MIVGVDYSSHRVDCVWLPFDGDLPAYVGQLDLPAEKDDHPAERLRPLRYWLWTTEPLQGRPDPASVAVVAIEQPVYTVGPKQRGNIDSLLLLATVAGALTAAVPDRIPGVWHLPANEWRPLVGIRGNLPRAEAKAAAVALVRRLVGAAADGWDENTCEAYLIAYAARSRMLDLLDDDEAA